MKSIQALMTTNFQFNIALLSFRIQKYLYIFCNLIQNEFNTRRGKNINSVGIIFTERNCNSKKENKKSLKDINYMKIESAYFKLSWIYFSFSFYSKLRRDRGSWQHFLFCIFHGLALFLKEWEYCSATIA